MKYLDTSALLKLLVRETHSAAMTRWAAGNDLWSSSLLAIEAHRAALRLDIPSGEIDALLDEITLVFPAPATFHAAQSIGQVNLRTLDALHLATALEIGDELECVVTYDQRLAASASTLGLDVVAPGLRSSWWAP
ncbi:MAG: type II toxin-antitoxin system VapC family toxin [Acidimicrobiia bacterium]